MTEWIYKRTEPELWTVGYQDSGGFEPESDHGSPEEAAARVRYLNGGTIPNLTAKLVTTVLTRHIGDGPAALAEAFAAELSAYDPLFDRRRFTATVLAGVATTDG